MKPPGCRGESAMTCRDSVIEYATEYRQVYGRPVLVISASDAADTLNDDAAVDKRGRGVGDCGSLNRYPRGKQFAYGKSKASAFGAGKR